MPSLVPIDCIIRTSYYSRLIFKTVWPLIAYAALGFASKVQRRRGKEDAADSLINFGFLVRRLTPRDLYRVCSSEELDPRPADRSHWIGSRARDMIARARDCFSLMASHVSTRLPYSDQA